MDKKKDATVEFCKNKRCPVRMWTEPTASYVSGCKMFSFCYLWLCKFYQKHKYEWSGLENKHRYCRIGKIHCEHMIDPVCWASDKGAFHLGIFEMEECPFPSKQQSIPIIKPKRPDIQTVKEGEESSVTQLQQVVLDRDNKDYQRGYEKGYKEGYPEGWKDRD